MYGNCTSHCFESIFLWTEVDTATLMLLDLSCFPSAGNLMFVRQNTQELYIKSSEQMY